MSIRHVYIVTCDGCGASAERRDIPRFSALVELENDGWDLGCPGDFCPACTAARRAPGAPTPAARGMTTKGTGT